MTTHYEINTILILVIQVYSYVNLVHFLGWPDRVCTLIAVKILKWHQGSKLAQMYSLVLVGIENGSLSMFPVNSFYVIHFDSDKSIFFIT